MYRFEKNPLWRQFFDVTVPDWVKSQYSPQESWKGKPFSEQDVNFFFKGVDELSALFTERRPKNFPDYFRTPKNRSSYLLYFLPHQAAKFSFLFETYSKAIDAALAHGKKTGTLSVWDLGSGPGTASFALLLELAHRSEKETIPPVHLHWIDLNIKVLKDGIALIEKLKPSLPFSVEVKTHSQSIWKTHLKDTSLVLMGNTLNEKKLEEAGLFLERTLPNLSGGGLLALEPAHKTASQILSQVRDLALEEKWIQSIWGPCLHLGLCPMAHGKDWCHTSRAGMLPLKWYQAFSQKLGSKREWMKFSYLWMASKEAPAPEASPELRRVLSNPITTGKKKILLICEPGRPGRVPLSGSKSFERGDLYSMGFSQKKPLKPISKRRKVRR